MVSRNFLFLDTSNFKVLKKNYSKGIELRGKTIGIIGLGRIGQEVAKIAIGIGMDVIACDEYHKKVDIDINFTKNKKLTFKIKTISKIELLKKADFVTLHIPAQKNYIIDSEEINLMKNGSAIINAARGGVINEVSLIAALDSGKLSFACLDTFEEEPKPEIKILMHPKISLTPHIGAATKEAQDRIGLELAKQIKDIFK